MVILTLRVVGKSTTARLLKPSQHSLSGSLWWWGDSFLQVIFTWITWFKVLARFLHCEVTVFSFVIRSTCWGDILRLCRYSVSHWFSPINLSTIDDSFLQLLLLQFFLTMNFYLHPSLRIFKWKSVVRKSCPIPHYLQDPSRNNNICVVSGNGGLFISLHTDWLADPSQYQG